MGNKLPILFSLGYGELGRFVRIEKTEGRERIVDVLYYPYGFGNIFKIKPSRIRNVPESAVKGPFYPPAGIEGVPREGIVVLILGENGTSWLADKIQLSFVGDVRRLEEELAMLRMSNKMKSIKIQNLYKGVETELKKVKDVSETLSKKQRPFAVRGRFDEDLEEI